MALTEKQLSILVTTERTASCLSVMGTIFIFVTFVSSPKFRRPINRLVFYASWGNALSNIGTLMSRSPIAYGSDSHVCQFQGFLLQWFFSSDVVWNLALATNVYLTLFRKYNAQQLKALEWRYLLACYGFTFLIAFIPLFPTSQARDKIYGDALLWCWIDVRWDFLRVALLYGPAWVCIIASLTIYVWAGREIFLKRHQLRAFRNTNEGVGPPGPSEHSDDTVGDDSLANYKTTNVEITSTIKPLENIAKVLLPGDVTGNTNPRGAHGAGIQSANSTSGKVYEQYSVNIGAQPMGSTRTSPVGIVSGGQASTLEVARTRKNRAALEANRAAWGYTKVALLFFISLLVTWVPSSVNRVYSLTHPGDVNVPLTYIAGVVLSLMGFWNSVIYTFTCRAACRDCYANLMRYRLQRRQKPEGSTAGRSNTTGHRTSFGKPKFRWGKNWERLQPRREGEQAQETV